MENGSGRFGAELPFSARVRRWIRQGLAEGKTDAESVSSALHVSARTFRRRLQEEGTSHQRILDEVRCGTARDALVRLRLPVGEVAIRSGFADSSSFGKAFRRWTGLSPKGYVKRYTLQRERMPLVDWHHEQRGDVS